MKSVRVALPLLLLVGVLVAPHAADAQPAGKVYRVGWLRGISPSTVEHQVNALKEGLRELGYVEGQNLLLDMRSADGHFDRLPALAAALVRDKADVIVSGTTLITRAAKQATSSIPIVMAGIADPVGSGLVADLARPGGNITGLSVAWGEGIKGKWVEFIKEAVPTASRIGVLVNSANPDHPAWFQEMDPTAARLNVKLHVFGMQDPAGFEKVFTAASRSRMDALIMISDSILMMHRSRIADLVARTRLAAIYPFREFVDVGGMMSYGVDQRYLHR